MTWRAVHPSLTEERRVPQDDADAPIFTLGFWPPIEAEKAKIYISKVRRMNSSPASEADELSRRASADLEAFWAMARFGVRGWSGLGGLSCLTESVRIDAREHVALTDESLQILYHNGLLLPVALECWKFNNLTEEEKKTSNSPSNSGPSMTNTAAPSATSDSAKGNVGAVSYGSTGASSMDAPTS